MAALGLLAVVLSGIFCLSVVTSPDPTKYKHSPKAPPRGSGTSAKPQGSKPTSLRIVK